MSDHLHTTKYSVEIHFVDPFVKRLQLKLLPKASCNPA